VFGESGIAADPAGHGQSRDGIEIAWGVAEDAKAGGLLPRADLFDGLFRGRRFPPEAGQCDDRV